MNRYAEISNEKQNGIIYTPEPLANYISLQMISFYSRSSDARIKILDPAIGDAELVISLIRNLIASGFRKISVIGFETESEAVESTKTRLNDEFPNIHVDIRHKDFVEYMLEERGTVFSTDDCCDCFDFIIANPPYIRTQILGAEKAQRLAKRLRLTGRVDIYYVFMLLSLELLSEHGIAGFITSNKFMTIKAGAQVRSFFRRNTTIKKVVDFGDTHIFTASVLPCIVVFGVKKRHAEAPAFSTIYEVRPESGHTPAEDFYEMLDSAGKYTLPSGLSYIVKVGKLPNTDDPTSVWTLKNDETSSWLNDVMNKQWKTFSDIGKIRVGIKTTADPVFIGDDWDKRGERPELLRPLITHRNAGQIIPNRADVWEVLYPHEQKDGKKRAIDIEKYPVSKAYLEKHKERLASRTYVSKANRKWYEIWVPQDPMAWADKKIVFRDISEQPMFWMDTTGAVVNGDCYWIDVKESTTEDVVLLALAVANSPFIEKFYDAKFNNKLYSGKRRYMSQYVEQFPIPNPEMPEAKEAIGLVRSIIEGTNTESFESVKAKIDELVNAAFLVE